MLLQIVGAAKDLTGITQVYGFSLIQYKVSVKAQEPRSI